MRGEEQRDAAPLLDEQLATLGEDAHARTAAAAAAAAAAARVEAQPSAQPWRGHRRNWSLGSFNSKFFPCNSEVLCENVSGMASQTSIQAFSPFKGVSLCVQEKLCRLRRCV